MASTWDKARIQKDIADVRGSYEAALRSFNDPNVTPEQRAQLAQQTIDRANWASRQMDEINSFGAQRKIDEAQGVLENIVEEMKPYTAAGNEWTNDSEYAKINILGKADVLRLPDEIIGRSLGAKAHNYDILDLETGDHYSLADSTKLQNVEVFAGKGTSVEYRKATWYANKYGGEVADWQHVKGIGTVETPEGQFKAELHWTQCEGFGKIDMFIKRWLE